MEDFNMQEEFEALKEEMKKVVGWEEITEWKDTEQYLEKFESFSSGKGDEIFKLYMKLFDKTSVNNPVYGHLTLHLILGQLFKHIKIHVGENVSDLRVHPFIIQDSGSGKSVAEPLVMTIAKGLKIPVYNATGEITEARLVGSWTIVEDLRKVGKKTVVVKRKELVPGILKTFEKGGIILFDEASVFLKAAEKDYNRLIVNYIQAAMNPIGSPTNRISRSLKGGTITIQPQCSFWFLSHPIEGDYIKTLQSGFFQRAIPVIRKLKEEDWVTIEKGVKELIWLAQNDEKSFKRLLEEYDRNTKEIIDYLREVKEWAKPIKKVYFQSREVMDELDNYTNMLKSELSNLKGEVKEVFNTFRIRSMINVIIIASHRALLDKRVRINKDDVSYASRLILNSVSSLIHSLEFMKELAQADVYMVRWRDLKKDWINIMRRVKMNRDGTFERKAFVKEVSNFFNISESSAYRYVQEWISRGLLEDVGSGKLKL